MEDLHSNRSSPLADSQDPLPFVFLYERTRFPPRKLFISARLLARIKQGAPAMSQKLDRFAPVQLARHTTELSTMFVVLAIAAVGLSFVVKACQFVGVPELVIQILSVLEYAILITDALALLCFVARRTWKFLRETE